jgi:DNA polymerase-1
MPQSNERKKLIVVDGSAVLTTQYYGTLPDVCRADGGKNALYQPMIKHAPDGRFTNGVEGTLRTIFHLLRYQKADYLAVVLDKSRDTFRTKLYPAYKAQRSEKPDPLKEQFETLKEILAACGVPVFEDDKFEADDLAGSILEQFRGNEDLDLYFYTKDHDYLQLVGENVRGYLLQPSMEKTDELKRKLQTVVQQEGLPPKTVLCDVAAVKILEGVLPGQVPDLKGIAGNSSDNIPGVHGVSAGTAVPLLNAYGSLEEILATVDARNGDPAEEKKLDALWKESFGFRGGKVKKFRENRGMATLSKRLATICRDVKVPKDLESYRPDTKKDGATEAMEALGFAELLYENGELFQLPENSWF